MVSGASHAKAIRFRLEGFPRDFTVDPRSLAAFMARRAPGRDALSTTRFEADDVELESSGGVIEGVIHNRDIRPNDYGKERTVPRPGHADFGQWIEMGRIPTGGGKNSGRLTVALCAAGGICKQWLARRGISVEAEIASIGRVTDPKRFDAEIMKARKSLDSVGGTIRCRASGVPAGLGGALFEGLEGAISQAVFAIPGVKGIEFGNGFEAATMTGGENNDAFVVEGGLVRTASNRHGGILGGRTTGMPVEFTVAMKPTPTIFKAQESVDLATMSRAMLTMKGRHDPCIVRRAVPVVEAMAAYALTDAILARESVHSRICLTLTGRTLEEDLAQYESQRYFSDMVEIRADLLSEDERERTVNLIRRLPVPVILTLRRKSDGGELDDAVHERSGETFFRKILLSVEPGVGRLYIDLEDDRRSEGLERLAFERGVGIVRSRHCFNGKPKDIVALMRKMRADTDAIAKVAFVPKNLAEVAAAYREMRDFGDFPHVLCIMGPLGLVSRACACRFGSAWTYASVGGLEGIGHVTPYELVRTYRFRQQTRDFALYGVTGWPLKATRSPEINNAAWADADEDRVMIPFPSRTAQEAVDFFMAMDMHGMAVTIPHKQKIIPLLYSTAGEVRDVGAVNTVTDSGGGLLTGFNTDAAGFHRAIVGFAGREDFSGMSVAVLGNGGASKAVVWVLNRLGARVRVFHRTTPRRAYDLIVNATPVDPIPKYRFTGREMVYDLVYVPAETAFMERARAAGCRVENGFSMLLAQAEEQRRIWSGDVV